MRERGNVDAITNTCFRPMISLPSEGRLGRCLHRVEKEARGSKKRAFSLG